MKRGDIYIVRRRNTVGSEIQKARPGIVVSCDALNNTSSVVEVVYLTTQPRRELPTHAHIEATGRPSVALCEQIDSVSLQLLGECVGHLSEEEMQDVNRALLCSLGLDDDEPATYDYNTGGLTYNIAELIAERNRYAAIIDLLLEGDE